MFVPAESENKSSFVPLWRASRRLLALGAVLLILFSASVVYSYSEKTAPTPILKADLVVYWNSTTASVATIKTLGIRGKTIYINSVKLTVAGAPGVSALLKKSSKLSTFDVFVDIKGDNEDTETAGKLNDVVEFGKSDADYFIIQQELEMWNNDTTYYTSAFLDNSDGKLVIYTDSISGTPIVKVNNSVYWNESIINSNYSDSFWWVPLPEGKLANISITGVTKKTIFKLVKVVWHTLDYRFATTDDDLNTLEPEDNYKQEEEMVLIGTEDLDQYIYNLVEEKLRQLGYTDAVENGFIYNITKPIVGFTELQYSTIEASVLGVLRFTLFESVRLGLFDGISNAFKSAVHRLQIGISGTVNTLVKRIQSTASYIKKNYDRFKNVYTTNVRKAVKKASEMGKGFIASIQGAVSGTVKAVGNFFNGVSKTVSKAVSGFVNNVKSGAEWVWKKVTTGLGTVYKAVSGFFGGIVSWFKKFWWAIVIIALLIFVPILVIVAMNLGPAIRRRF